MVCSSPRMMKIELLPLLILSFVIGQGSTSMAQAQSFSSVVIGGFDYIRSGGASFPIGGSFSQARSAILSNYPATVFASFTTLAATNLANVDILIIGTAATITNDINPLSTEEQAALLDFVKTGGAAVLFTDNNSFSAFAYAANTGFLAPFGMGSDGALVGEVPAVVPTPSQHPLTRGPFGSVSRFTEFVPGAITNLGPYAISLATNFAGTALAVIDPGVIVPGSGPVVAFSDISGFWDTDGYFPGNATLFLNVIDYCRNTPQGWRLSIEQRGTNVVLHWPTTATNMVLEATTNLATGSIWKQVTNDSAVVDGENVVTNQIVGRKFYRLVSVSR
jgi:hypothetical protein